MALPAIVVSHTVAVAALKEGLSLCQSIISYRIATQQIELQRAHMHSKANAFMQQLENEYNSSIARLNTIAHAHKITLDGVKTSNEEVVNMIEKGQLELDKYLSVVVSPDVSDDIKQSMMTVISQLSQQNMQLASSHIQNSRAPIDALVVVIDGLRNDNQPRTFTDVS